jgi:nucleotide-binding universal stress UspA family protein
MPAVVGPSGPPVVPPVERAAVDRAGEWLDGLAGALGERIGATPSTRVLTGPPGPELARVTREEGAALLAVGASQRGPLAGAIAGTVSRYATHHGRCPTLVCPR